MTLEELYTCEHCNDMLTESKAHTVTETGYQERIVLSFCDDCYDNA